MFHPSGAYRVLVLLTSFCNGGWMMIVCISRAPFLFRPWRCKLQEAGIIEAVLSSNDD